MKKIKDFITLVLGWIFDIFIVILMLSLFFCFVIVLAFEIFTRVYMPCDVVVESSFAALPARCYKELNIRTVRKWKKEEMDRFISNARKQKALVD